MTSSSTLRMRGPLGIGWNVWFLGLVLWTLFLTAAMTSLQEQRKEREMRQQKTAQLRDVQIRVGAH